MFSVQRSFGNQKVDFHPIGRDGRSFGVEKERMSRRLQRLGRQVYRKFYVSRHDPHLFEIFYTADLHIF